MELSKVVEIFVSSIIMGIYFIYCGKRLLRKSIPRKLNTLLLVIILILFITINYLFLDNAAKMMTLYIVVLFMFKKIFKKNMVQCAIAALIAYFLLVFGEVIFVVMLSTLKYFNIISNMENFTGSIDANFFICLISTIALLIIDKPFSKIISKVKESSKIVLVFTFSIILMAICVLFYKMSLVNWKYDYTLILNIILIISMMYIGFILIKQHLDKSRISEEHERNVEYYKQSEKLVEQYSMSQHENKNELLIIRSMVHKSNTRLLSYLDEILKSKENIENAWIRYLAYIPFGGVKGILHSKISAMIEDNINLFVNISKEVEKSNLKYLSTKENNQLSKILGVFLDNAREATLNSVLKESSVSIYMEDKRIVFEIANSFNNEVDLNNIYNLGYSSKGKNRGYGLSLVKSIIDENDMFENITEIRDEYFIQIIKVNKQK